MNELIERARVLRAMIEANAQSMDDIDAINYIELFPAWDENSVSYEANSKVRYAGMLYKVLQNHVSQSGWTPSDSPSLFARMLAPEPEIIYDWEQPDSTNGYSVGDKVLYNGVVYISLIDNNIWSPGGYPAGWNTVE